MLSRPEKEKFLNQKSLVVWFTGLSGAGKSTVGLGLEKLLFKNGFLAQVLDGDNIRKGINSNLGFSLPDRRENIRRIAEVSKLFIDSGIICINCFVSPTIEIRQLARQIIGTEDFIEIFVKASLQTCEKRDVKGLYKKARNGEIKDFTGISSTFDEPQNPNLVLDTEILSIDQSITNVYSLIYPLISNVRI